MDTDFKPPSAGPASLFATAARQPRKRPVLILAWCEWTGERQEMTWVRDQGNNEVYLCPCGHEHKWAVR
jgi:hypothetical protein